MISYDFYFFLGGGGPFLLPTFPVTDIWSASAALYRPTSARYPKMFYYFSLSGELPDSPGEEWFSWIRLSQKRVHEETFVFFGGGEKHGTWLVIRVALGCWERDMCNSNYVCFLRIFFVFLKHQTHISRILQRNTVVVPSKVLHDLFKVRSAFRITSSLLRLPWNHDKSWILQNSATRREEHRKYAGLDHAMLLEFTMMCALARKLMKANGRTLHIGAGVWSPCTISSRRRSHSCTCTCHVDFDFFACMHTFVAGDSCKEWPQYYGLVAWISLLSYSLRYSGLLNQTLKS